MINSRFSITVLAFLYCFTSALAQKIKEPPGKNAYLFDLSIVDYESQDQPASPVTGASIEVFNRTLNKSEFVLKDHPAASFQPIFEQGNHYAIMIRKTGYLAKRVEVYLHINDCIFCVDGVRTLGPGAALNKMNTLSGTIELERAVLDKRIKLQGINYENDRWDVDHETARQLDQIVTLIKDNPGLTFELASHTDSRGKDDYNLTLSQKRADAAMAYIVNHGMDSTLITAKGYGETQLLNHCVNGTNCTEAEHLQNRRTELRITGIQGVSRGPSLEQMIVEEQKVVGRPEKPEKSINDDKIGSMKPESLKEKGYEDRSVPPTPPFGTGMPAGSGVAEDIVLRITILPEKYTGYAIEIAQNSKELPADHPAFREQREVMLLEDNAGNFCYFLGNIGGREKAYDYYRRKIRSSNRDARMVIFGQNGKKAYLKP